MEINSKKSILLNICRDRTELNYKVKNRPLICAPKQELQRQGFRALQVNICRIDALNVRSNFKSYLFHGKIYEKGAFIYE